MAVGRTNGSFSVHCDADGCHVVYECDEMTASAGEARYCAIQSDWQSNSRDGRREDRCPKHRRADVSPGARELRDEIGHPPRRGR